MKVKIELLDDRGRALRTLWEPYPISYLRYILIKDEINRAAREHDPNVGEKGVRQGTLPTCPPEGF